MMSSIFAKPASHRPANRRHVRFCRAGGGGAVTEKTACLQCNFMK